MRTRLSGWGRFRPVQATEIVAADLTGAERVALPGQGVIARGLGRSYGDAAQRCGGTVLTMTGCRGVEWVDREAGVVRAQAGATIGGLIDRFAPKGWFVPVSPGTRQVTVGGAIAADIHGKNHHRDGSFGNHVRSIRLRLASDQVVTVGPDRDPELFWATVGGMGLTGVILDADISMMAIETGLVAVETLRLPGLAELMAELRASDTRHAFSVAWVDLLAGGRSVLTQGSFATPDQVAAHGGAVGRLPQPGSWSIGLPPGPIPRLTWRPAMRVFNQAWFLRAPAEPTTTLESITGFWHPLDALADWNRLYGPGGFVQWQFAVPDTPVGDDALVEIVERLGELPSFLTVLKRLGPKNPAPLSFPMPGWTLAVDLPATPTVLAALDRLDELVIDAGGRIYLAKDARMSPATLAGGYPRLAEWQAVRDRVDPDRRFASDLAQRLGLV